MDRTTITNQKANTIDPTDYERLTPAEAIALQKQLRNDINIKTNHLSVRYIAGADISFNRFEKTVYAGIVVLKYPDMTPVEKVSIISATQFPYIPGLLSFREIPSLIKVWQLLKQKPDILVLDGHGIAHPRRVGIAVHFGLLMQVPCIGCAKTKLIGHYEEPATAKFAESALIDQKERIGTVLRTKLNCKPVFISPGHELSIKQSVEIIKNCTGKYRIPEPTRLAHILVNEVRLQHKIQPKNAST